MVVLTVLLLYSFVSNYRYSRYSTCSLKTLKEAVTLYGVKTCVSCHLQLCPLY